MTGRVPRARGDFGSTPEAEQQAGTKRHVARVPGHGFALPEAPDAGSAARRLTRKVGHAETTSRTRGAPTESPGPSRRSDPDGLRRRAGSRQPSRGEPGRQQLRNRYG